MGDQRREFSKEFKREAWCFSEQPAWEAGYGTVLDQAVVPPDSKPSENTPGMIIRCP